MTNQLLNDCVNFAQRLIQTPSMTFEEEAIAHLIAAEMRQLGFDDVWLDELNNVNGRIHGQDRSLPAIVLNAHLDHVDPGDPSLWPVPPYSGEIVNGRILGRGACDIKGPLAVQVYAIAGLLQAGERPRRDVVFSGVVEEEIGGTGAQYWVENLDYDVGLVVLAEPSDNTLSLGHRSGMSAWVKFSGRSVHASVPASGVNPNYYLATFLERLKGAQHDLSAHPYLGPTTVAPTIIEVDTKSSNVTPAWTRVLLDIRTASESTRSLRDFIHKLAHDLPYELAPERANTPIEPTDDILIGYDTPPESEAAQRAQALISAAVGHNVPFTSYSFSTDGRLFPPFGLTNIIGYSAGEENLAHTVRESIAIDKMGESLVGHMALLREF